MLIGIDQHLFCDVKGQRADIITLILDLDEVDRVPVRMFDGTSLGCGSGDGNKSSKSKDENV